jgi:hypothetical protein
LSSFKIYLSGLYLVFAAAAAADIWKLLGQMYDWLMWLSVFVMEAIFIVKKGYYSFRLSHCLIIDVSFVCVSVYEAAVPYYFSEQQYR